VSFKRFAEFRFQRDLFSHFQQCIYREIGWFDEYCCLSACVGFHLDVFEREAVAERERDDSKALTER